MKADQYLNMCIQQATLSPIHHRHGCIIVSGGKILSRGYNHYRSGFDGGALKTGRIASRPAWKRNHKLKPKTSKKRNVRSNSGMSGGIAANMPLSCHAEMAAIHSALAASSAPASTARAYRKPIFKLPVGSKRGSQLWAYVERMCAEQAIGEQQKSRASAERSNSKSPVQAWLFEPCASQPDARAEQVSRWSWPESDKR
jgi:deoxycytidylate deaminase